MELRSPRARANALYPSRWKRPFGYALVLFAAVFFLAARLPSNGGPANQPAPAAVPPPVTPASALPMPPLRPIIQPLNRPDVAEIQALTPRVEIWRLNGQLPQVPARATKALERALVTGNDPVTVRLQFGRRMAGQQITVIAANGIVLDAPEQVLTISAAGDCTFAARLESGAPRGHLIVNSKMIRTIVPLSRASLARVQAEETRTGGGH